MTAAVWVRNRVVPLMSTSGAPRNILPFNSPVPLILCHSPLSSTDAMVATTIKPQVGHRTLHTSVLAYDMLS